MRGPLIVVILALLVASAAEAQKVKTPLLRAQVLAVAAASDNDELLKAVPRKDKALVDINGTVYSVSEPISADCGNPALGAPVTFVNVYSTGSPLRYIGIGCAGPTLGICLSLRPGQRVRIQGTMALMPDFTREDFDPCDINTWFLPEVPTFDVLVATKVTR